MIHASSATLASRQPAAVEAVFAAADIRVGGVRPWDVQVHDPACWQQVLSQGSLGLGDTYVAGQWDCGALDQFFTRLLLVQADDRLGQGHRWRLAWHLLRDRLFNLQSLGRSTRVARQHYDLHPEVFAAMLDPWRQYSCGYWERAGSLAEAQEHKLRLIAAKLQLEPGMRVLDIGCGWGGLSAYLARHHGVEVVGITLSAEQLEFAREHWTSLPLRFELCDYRQLDSLELPGVDRIVSVGMFEHVGPDNARGFFAVARQALRDDGLLLLHTIGYRLSTRRTDPWIDAHVFPHGRLLSPRDLASALEPHFLVEDWHNFGPDYDPTLMAWHRNVEQAWPGLEPLIAECCGGLESARGFRRFWRYYLLCCAGFFRARQGQLWQLVLSPALAAADRPAYRSVRPGSCALAPSGASLSGA
ncbi:MAG: cyclopropane fatty acyl phospholipid synthase [Prochlorococcaceae cyanobacterium]